VTEQKDKDSKSPDLRVAPPETTSSNAVPYKQTDDAKKKVDELLAKRAEYVEAVKKIDELVSQLQYGITQYSDGRHHCNGFGVGFDLTDYTCRELCKRELHVACKTMSLASRGKQKLDPKVFGVAIDRKDTEV